MLPDVEGEEGLEPVGDGVVGASVLGDGQLPGGIGLKPDPTAAEKADAFGFELGLEGFQTPPLLFNLRGQGSRRGTATGSELQEVQLMIEDLAGVVENGRDLLGSGFGTARKDNDLFEAFAFKRRSGNQFVQIVHIGLQMLSVMEGERLVAHDRGQGFVGKVNQGKHRAASLFHWHFHHHFLHGSGLAVDGQAGLVGIVREDHQEVAFADDQIGSGTTRIAGGVLGGIVRDAFHHLLQRLASDDLPAGHDILHIGILAMRFVSFFVDEPRFICADDRFHAVFQERGSVFRVGRYRCDVVQRHVERRGQAFVKADIFDVIVNHLLV